MLHVCIYIYILYTHTATYGNYVYHMFLQSVDTTIHWIKWSWMNGSFCKEVRRWLRIINDFKHVLTDNGFLFESFGIRLEHRLRHLTLRFFLFFCEASCGARWTHHVQGFSVWLMLGQPSWMGFLKAFLNISAYEVEQPRICEWVLLMAISPKGEIGKLIAWVYFYILYFTNMCFPQMVKCLFW